MKEYFVSEESIVREIWGNADTVLFIFAGASAEFALSKAVDWLYFTGRLPADPLGRLFSTVNYAQRIIFAAREDAFHAIDQISAVHRHVEAARQQDIPDWAYRDVLFLLIDYSIRSFETLERRLNDDEKNDIFDVFYRLGDRMRIPDLPVTFRDWELRRAEHLAENLVYSHFSRDLHQQYRKHLGTFRYVVLQQVQGLVTPGVVRKLLGLPYSVWLIPVIGTYKLLRRTFAGRWVKQALLPADYAERVNRLDVTRMAFH